LLDSFGRFYGDVLVPFGVVLAAFVTIHVLLHKREVASAIGWIGLAWFAPFFGGFAYFVLGVNRVQRRARQLRGSKPRRARRGSWPPPDEDDHLSPLERTVGRLTERPTEDGNAFEIFHDGDEAYPVMLEAIGCAESSVGMSSYIMRADEWGGRFIDALAAAQRRGVAVRVIVDGVGGGWIRSGAYHRLHHAGVPAGRFMHSPLPWRMPFLNLRTHKKILVVDGRIGFTGGINIGDENVLATRPPQPVRDTHFRVQGPVLQQLTEAFARDWAFVMEEELDGEAWFPALGQAGGATARVIASGPDEDIEKVEFAVLQAVACARTSIQLMTPYFLPEDRLLTALSLAAMRGVAVDVTMPEISDHRLIDWATRANVGPLLKDGGRVWLCPPPFRHSKMMVVDDEWSLIGSSNWDMRSFRLNFELCMEVYDRPMAAALQAVMANSRGPALTEAALEARQFLVRLRDAGVRLLLPYL
jgi:cardiolipin synthase